MKKLIFRTVSTLILSPYLLTACFKGVNGNPELPPIDDNVVGIYSGQEQPLTLMKIDIEIYKIENNKYGMRKITMAGFPDFVFVEDTAKTLVAPMQGTKMYSVPFQTIGTVTLSDSSWLSYRGIDKSLDFELKSITSGTITRFYGKKN